MVESVSEVDGLSYSEILVSNAQIICGFVLVYLIDKFDWIA